MMEQDQKERASDEHAVGMTSMKLAIEKHDHFPHTHTRVKYDY